MRTIIAFVVMSFGWHAAHAGQAVFSQAGARLGNYAEEQCGPNHYCYESGGKIVKSPHYLYGVSTSTTLTQALCGVTLNVTAPSSLTLPAASGVSGCRYEVLNSQSTWSSGTDNAFVKIVPASASEHIRVLAANAGNKLKNSTFGNSVIVESNGSFWVPIGKEQGTWTELTNGN